MNRCSRDPSAAASVVEIVVTAALTNVAADLPTDAPVAAETGDDLGAAMLQFCATLVRPATAPPLVAIVKPPAGGQCLASAWHCRQGRTRVLLTPTDQPYAAMAEAALGAGCEVLLLGSLPRLRETAGVNRRDRLSPAPQNIHGLIIRQPFLNEAFVTALAVHGGGPGLLAACRAELARRVFSPTD